MKRNSRTWGRIVIQLQLDVTNLGRHYDTSMIAQIGHPQFLALEVRFVQSYCRLREFYDLRIVLDKSGPCGLSG